MVFHKKIMNKNFSILGFAAGAVGGFTFALSGGASLTQSFLQAAIGAIIGLILFTIMHTFGTPTQGKYFKNISASELKAMREAQPNEVLLIDVRTAAESNQRAIADTAAFIDIMSSAFDSKIEALDRNKTYIIYCRSGNRSAQACSIMERKGFQKLYNLAGGISAYRD
jgi:rhodanese-related sulfurtransferase